MLNDLGNFRIPKSVLSGEKDKRRASFTQFRRDENGSLIIFSLFLLILMLMIAGMAVDLMRSESHRARLQGTLDRAVLAGASLEQTLNSEDVVLDYFNKAGLGAFITADDITVVEDATSKTVTASAQMTVGTYFMKLMGIDRLQAPASGQAEESLSDVEISLVVDVSGSMRWDSASGNAKIDDLIAAANEFVYLMQCDPDAEAPFDNVCVITPNTVSISLVPYDEQVLVGESLLQEFNISNEHTDSSCVDFEDVDFETTALSPTQALNRSGTIDPWRYYNGSVSTRTPYAYSPSNIDYRSCNPDTRRDIVPYATDYISLQSDIGELFADGSTSIDLGVKWGAALLDPAFRPALASLTLGGSPLINPAMNGRPYNYGRPRTKKVIVLMTDGQNTKQSKLKAGYRSGPSPFWVDPDTEEVSVYYAYYNQYYHDDPDGHSSHWSYSPEGGGDAVQLTYPELWNSYTKNYFKYFNWLGDPVDEYFTSDMNDNLDQICSAAKAQGIEIFTLGFETSSTSSAVMSSCASSDAHHFDVTGSTISAAFNSIAREINELRLTQ